MIVFFCPTSPGTLPSLPKKALETFVFERFFLREQQKA